MSRGLLTMFAGGDPWKVNASLQSGRPAQIAELGQAFHNAGQSTYEADNAFTEARRRVDAWINDNGQHPINDSAEVQRTATALGVQAAQLPKIAVDLENVAGALAQAQGSANGFIATLESRLQTLDDWIGQAEDLIEQERNLLARADDEDDICELEDDIVRLEQYISECEHEAIDDTKATLQQVEQVREGYSGELQRAEANLRTDGYDPAAIQGLDGEHTKDPVAGDIAPSGLEAAELAELQRITNQAVADQVDKVRKLQQAIDYSLATAYSKGQGSPEGQAALARVPQLKKERDDALEDLHKLPDYNNVDPTTMRTSPDGHFIFGYNLGGQPVQVTGQLKNGTGEIFDQATGSYYSFKDGKLTGIRTPDRGSAEATSEPLLSAVTLATGAPELKAGGEVLWQGLRPLLERETVASGADIASQNFLPRAAQNLATQQTDHAPISLPPSAAADHPAPLTTSDRPAPATPHDPPLSGTTAHATAPPAAVEAPPPPLPAESPLFDGYHPADPGPEFTKADGSLIYPDDSLASKPYAIPGTVIPDAHLPQGTELGRFGYPGGTYLAPDGTPFAELSLPPASALKPYYQYVVNDPTALPPGWHVEQSQAASWFHQPGAGTQYRIIAPPGEDPSVDELVQSGYLKVVVKQ